MRLITDEWRLKLLALGLAVLMLGAVAFSQTNTRILQVSITYINAPTTPAPLVLVAPPDRIAVTVSAPSDLPLTSNSVIATADLSHIKKGPAVSVPLQVRTTDQRIGVQSPAPIVVNVDDLTPVQLLIQVRTPAVLPGWAVTTAVARCGNSSQSCSVAFVGPASFEQNLDAFVTVGSPSAPIEGSADSLNVPVQFEQNGRPIDMTKVETIPQISITPAAVNVHVESRQGTASIQVTLVDSTPTHYPPPGYHVTNTTVTPLTVLCIGTADAIAKFGSPAITLPGVDLSHSTSTATFKVLIPTTVTGVACSPSAATVTYTIAPNPVTQPSPSASPT